MSEKYAEFFFFFFVIVCLCILIFFFVLLAMTYYFDFMNIKLKCQKVMVICIRKEKWVRISFDFNEPFLPSPQKSYSAILFSIHCKIIKQIWIIILARLWFLRTASSFSTLSFHCLQNYGQFLFILCAHN